MRYLLLACCLAAQVAYGQYSGSVFVDSNGNGKRDADEKGLPAVAVTDGLHVVRTAADGSFSLPGFDRTRFITVTTPSGYKPGIGHFLRVDSGRTDYAFGLLSDERAREDGLVRMIQISDTETDMHGEWIYDLKQYARAHGVDFILHNGDICYEPGMRFHASHFNSEALGVPVFYAVGNHDLVKGAYGEELFEQLFGPTHYSFDVGDVHVVVTPMAGGDHAPSYRQADMVEWVRNDLELVGPEKAVVFVNHSHPQDGSRYVLGNNAFSVDLLDHNLKAWFYGHWHSNYVFKDKRSGVYSICTAPINKGGIDNSAARFVVATIGKEGVVDVESRYAFLDNHVVVASPGKHGDLRVADGKLQVSAQVYDSRQQVDSVSARLVALGNRIPFGDSSLARRSDWNWSGEIALPAACSVDTLVLEVEVHYRNGKMSVARQRLGADKQTADSAVSGQLRLEWTKNAGGEIWKSAPLVADGIVYTATIDDAMLARCHIQAFDAADGDVLWKFPAGNSVKNRLGYWQGTVLATDVAGMVYALDARSGKLLWSKRLRSSAIPGYITAGVVADGVYYVGSGEYFQALDIATGETRWQNTAWSGGEGTGSAMSISGEVLITGANWNALFGHDRSTGALLWKRNEDGLRFRSSSGTLADGKYVVGSGNTLFELDAETGATLRKRQTPYNFNVMAAPLLTAAYIVLPTADVGVVAFDRYTLEEAWKFTPGEALVYSAPYTGAGVRTVESSVVQWEGWLVFGASDGKLYVLDQHTGKAVAERNLGAPIFADIHTGADNRLYVGDFAGNVYCFSVHRSQ
ncbi:PQQ-binding-like beta-propeller repeat protein [Parapedobacter deserti]|uniref:PQQ-binding-like beta-propeller repeat protein n=1 Tax=Parapedobacter deserti TaxID=1912957 RepID=A0ABV7JJU5_9SPHI